MNELEHCPHCKWLREDRKEETIGVCGNCDSSYVGERMYPTDYCNAWEGRTDGQKD